MTNAPGAGSGAGGYESGPRNNQTKPGKVNILWLMLNLIFLIIFNVFFFMLGNLPHNMSVWISYGFIHFAYFMLIATPVLTRKGKSSAVFGFALNNISATYFIAALFIGIIFILISPEGYTAALLVQLTVAGIYGIILIANLIANERTADAEESRQYQINYVKNASAQLKGILDRVKDKDAKRRVERAYDSVYSSPVKSHPNLEQMEIRILAQIDELDNTVTKGDNKSIISVADSLVSAVNERNTRLRNYNK